MHDSVKLMFFVWIYTPKVLHTPIHSYPKSFSFLRTIMMSKSMYSADVMTYETRKGAWYVTMESVETSNNKNNNNESGANSLMASVETNRDTHNASYNILISFIFYEIAPVYRIRENIINSREIKL